jgi:hypothetical protein
MQLEFIFQNFLVIGVVCFGACCVVGLAVVIPVVANVILAVYSAVAGEMTQAHFAGVESGVLYPDERKTPGPRVVIGYPPGHKKEVAGPAPAVEVEPDEVPTGMLVRLAVALTLVAAGLVFGATQLFDYTLTEQMEAKGYENAGEAIPRTSAK